LFFFVKKKGDWWRGVRNYVSGVASIQPDIRQAFIESLASYAPPNMTRIQYLPEAPARWKREKTTLPPMVFEYGRLLTRTDATAVQSILDEDLFFSPYSRLSKKCGHSNDMGYYGDGGMRTAVYTTEELIEKVDMTVYPPNTVSCKAWPAIITELKSVINRSLHKDWGFNVVIVNHLSNGKDYMGFQREKDLARDTPVAMLYFGFPRPCTFLYSNIKGDNVDITAKDYWDMPRSVEHGSCLVMHFPTNLIYYRGIRVDEFVFLPLYVISFMCFA
jgi:hypothetical protein